MIDGAVEDDSAMACLFFVTLLANYILIASYSKTLL